MVDTPKDRKQADLIEKRRELGRTLYENRATFQPNPLYAKDVFEPESYLSTRYGDPASAEPLPSGRYADPTIPSPLSAVRAVDIPEFRENPEQFIKDNAQTLNNEQSLLDKGKSMFARVFDYRDAADASLFGVDLSAVESTWDGFLRYMTGAYDLLNVGFGGLISAAPGGVRTLSYEELSGGKTVGEVLSGEMEPGSAPSPGQIAITSVGLEAARIRNGKARLSDILLANPATGPFILAGLAAETSPIQQPGFDIMDKEQREAAFSSGFEQWMSGITDAGLMFADPLIGVGVAAKALRLGLLGTPGGLKQGIEMGRAVDDGVDALMPVMNQTGRTSEMVLQEYRDYAMRRRQRIAEGDALSDIKAGNVPEPIPMLGGRITETTPTAQLDGTVGGFIADAVRVKEDGTKVMKVDELLARPEIASNPNATGLADALHKTTDPVVAGLILKAAQGTPGAMGDLLAVAPAQADFMFRAQRYYYSALAQTEPAKVAEVRDMMSRVVENTDSQIKFVEDQQKRLLVDPEKPSASSGQLDNVKPESKEQWLQLEDSRLNLQATLDEATELYKVVAEGKIIDPLDPSSPLHRPEIAKEIIDDLHRQQDAVTTALNKEIANTSMEARMTFPTKNNAYSQMVMKSRKRRTTARYQYAAEGTSIFPRLKPTGDLTPDGVPIMKSDGWFSPSEFEGVGRFSRNIRVWRWMGKETPSGWIGLKGTSTVGSEREFTAALDLDIYKSDNVRIRIEEVVADPDGPPGATKTVERFATGRERRDELFQKFASAMNDPNADSYKAMLDVEDAVTADLAMVYGQPSDKLQLVAKRGKQLRDVYLEQIRKNGYFVDEAGDVHHAPWLEIHSANGTYMQNFIELEKILRKEVKNDGGSRLRSSWDIGQNLASSGYELFNNFWRPATLMRLSYTQRNVFEGMIRAMAYQASLAPLTWPVRATVNGTRNKVMKNVAARKAKVATKKVDQSAYGQMVREQQEAATELGILRSGLEFKGANDSKPMVYVLRRQDDGSFKEIKIDPKEYEKQLTAQEIRVKELEARMEANVKDFDAAVENTAFGDWRKKELADIEKQIQSHDKEINGITELLMAPDVNGNLLAFEEAPALVRQIGEITNRIQYLKNRESRIKFQPQASIAEYQGMAGRQRRIGSGTSIGPDGNYYNDAWTGPLDQVNRALMSADNTVKQQLSLSYNVWDSLFYRVMVKQNTPIEYTSATRNEWAEGMVGVIDDLASSRIVQRLVENGFDTEDAVKWMTQTDEGLQFYGRLRLMFGDSVDNPAKISDTKAEPDVRITAPGETDSKRLKAFAEDIPTATGEKITVFNMDDARTYVNDVNNKIAKAMQQQEAFVELLRRRIAEKRAQVGGIDAPSTTASGVDANAVKAAIDSLPPEVRENLGYTMGDSVIQMGTEGPMKLWANFTNRIFRGLGTIPEDAVVRGPFYNTRFKATRNTLIEQYWAERGMDAADIRKTKKARTKEGRQQGLTIEHDEFVIPAKELSRIEVLAHRQALKDTREWMYTIERRTKLGKYGEWIFPFISATQNSTVTMGKLLYKEPWLAPFIADLWRMPNRLGVEDEDGNILMPMPFSWVKNTLANNPDIPFIGGAVDSLDEIRIPKDGLNVIAPETGFGLIPRPSAWVQVGASELMKANAFPVETPQILRSAMGDEAADEAYQMLKDYVFGEEQGMSAAPLSGDKLMPAWMQKVVQSKDELSRQYGYQWQLQYHTQMARWRGGERDEPPTENEIAKRTTNSFWFAFLGNMGVPTPLTPYPILTRPLVDNPVTVMQDTYQKYREADPLNANMNFNNDFGDWALEMANSKVTRNVGGADPTPEVISDIKTFDGLIRKVAPAIGEDLSVLGIITNNRTSQSSYEASAYRWQTSQKIPGTNREWREVQAPEMSVAERQRVTGWTLYRQFMDQLDAKLQNAGLSSYEVAGARELKDARERFVANMMQNPEYAGWLVDYQDRGGARTNAAVRTMELAVSDDTFRNELISTGNEQLYGIMSEYIYYRRGIIQEIERTGNSINHQDNVALKIAWANMRQKWKNRSVRWAEIADLYLSGDDDPQNPGSYLGELAMASGVSRE